MEEMGSSQKCLYYWENFEHVICKRELFKKKIEKKYCSVCCWTKEQY